MGVFSSVDRIGHTHVLFGADDASGLRAIIAIHSTALGPALGGTRFFPYASDEDALRDVLRLSRGMTLKNAAAGLDLGGGKAVIIGDPHKLKSERLLRAYGRFVNSLHGLYVTAEDVGTTTDDMAIIGRETKWVAGQARWDGGSGDPSPSTALGLFSSLQAVAEHLWGSPDLQGKRIAVQGVGKVGHAYVQLLTGAGANVFVADMWQPAVDRAVQDFGATQVGPDEILTLDVDIISPCAMGAVLTEDTIPTLKCLAVVGSANNQLGEDKDADRLADRGILYAPDFVVNAGGVINVAEELRGYRDDRAEAHVRALQIRTKEILATAAERGINPHQAAVDMAMERIESIGDLRRIRRDGNDRN
ncbi:MAG: leucine dehydrogenase [Acidimicrobiia bacterium]|nr:leucine dehydrogenase [Acidimicrobiia bacterium]